MDLENEDDVLFALYSGLTEDAPKSFEEINNRKDRELWKNAIKEELNVLE